MPTTPPTAVASRGDYPLASVLSHLNNTGHCQCKHCGIDIPKDLCSTRFRICECAEMCIVTAVALLFA